MCIVISVITCFLMILSIIFYPSIKIKNFKISLYWIICLIGALLLICFHQVDLNDIKNEFINNSSINPLKILLLFFSMTFISIFLDEVGFFKLIAIKILSKVNNKQITLFICLYFLVAILTVFTSNDIIVLTFTPFICYFCKKAGINPLPYLVGIFISSNTYSMMFIIGNPTNIYLATSQGIDFISYFKIMFIPTILSGLIEFIILILLFRKNLNDKILSREIEKQEYNKFLIIIGLIHLFICLIFLIISSYLNIEMYLISLISALSLLIISFIYFIVKKIKLSKYLDILKRLPFELIPFMLSMFIIVLALNKQNIPSLISNYLNNGNEIINYGISSFLMCNVMNNIPMSVFYASIINIGDLKATYSTIIGSNLGAFLTPIGALAGIMFTSLLKKYDVKYTFLDFIKYGGIISIPTLLVALFSLMLFI